MNGESIQVDDDRFRQNWHQFLKHPASIPVREELESSWALCFIGWFFLLIAGLIMLVTIRWALDGLKALWSVITFEPFGALRNNPSPNPDAYQPILAFGVIIGPDQKHALALATFKPSREVSLDQVAQVAGELGFLYTGPEAAKIPRTRRRSSCCGTMPIVRIDAESCRNRLCRAKAWISFCWTWRLI